MLYSVGISRDNLNKRRATGGKRAPIRMKRKFELGRPPAGTKVHRRSNMCIEDGLGSVLGFKWDILLNFYQCAMRTMKQDI